jgi:hypothetical protein
MWFLYFSVRKEPPHLPPPPPFTAFRDHPSHVIPSSLSVQEVSYMYMYTVEKPKSSDKRNDCVKLIRIHLYISCMRWFWYRYKYVALREEYIIVLSVWPLISVLLIQRELDLYLYIFLFLKYRWQIHQFWWGFLPLNMLGARKFKLPCLECAAPASKQGVCQYYMWVGVRQTDSIILTWNSYIDRNTNA